MKKRNLIILIVVVLILAVVGWFWSLEDLLLSPDRGDPYDGIFDEQPKTNIWRINPWENYLFRLIEPEPVPDPAGPPPPPPPPPNGTEFT